MRRELFVLVGIVAAVGMMSCGATKDPHSPRMRMTPKEIVQQSSDGIVRIEAGDDKVGTGFILDANGLVATNLHVVAGETDIKVKLHDGTSHVVMQVASYDGKRDLALLRIAKPTQALKTLRLGDSDQMTAGDQVIAIGNPLGFFDYSVTDGLLSQVRPYCTDADGPRCPPGGFKYFQISAAISQGSSGGPLFNQFGEVIAVTTGIIPAAQSINFAVPTNYLKNMLAQPGSIAMDRFAAETAFDESAERDKQIQQKIEELTKLLEDPKLTSQEKEKLRKLIEELKNPRDVAIKRMVPKHPLTVLDGCSDQQVIDVVQAITGAIDIGAPLYNDGMKEGSPNASGMEACFRIYEGTSTKLERDPPCKGVGKAFGDGLLRASTMATYKEKAWALRDAFDGLIDVAIKRGVKPGKP